MEGAPGVGSAGRTAERRGGKKNNYPNKMEEEERARCGSFERGRQLLVGVIAISCGEEKLTFHCLLGDDCLLATRFLSTSNRLQHRGQRLAATTGITLTREGLDGE